MKYSTTPIQVTSWVIFSSLLDAIFFVEVLKGSCKPLKSKCVKQFLRVRMPLWLHSYHSLYKKDLRMKNETLKRRICKSAMATKDVHTFSQSTAF